MDVLITYDVAVGSRLMESKNSEVKDAMKQQGYNDHFVVTDKQTGKKTTYYLPNTTLWKKDTTPKDAKAILLAVAEEQDAEIERLIAVEFTDVWAAIPGKPYKR